MKQDWYIQAAIDLGDLEPGFGYTEDQVTITPEIESRANYIDTLMGIREARTNLLKDSDWTQSLDSPLSDNDKELWKTYRQALRDCPNELIEGEEDVFEFPTRPDSTG